MSSDGRYHYVYTLVRDQEPIYIGVSYRPKVRESQHRSNKKNFDYLMILAAYKDRGEAEAVERSLIRHMMVPLNKHYNTIDMETKETVNEIMSMLLED